MNFSVKLKQLRMQHHLTQDQLGDILCVTNKAISKWETGLNEPCLDILVAIADYFKVSLDYLIRDNDNVDNYDGFEKIEVDKVCNDDDFSDYKTSKPQSNLSKQLLVSLINTIQHLSNSLQYAKQMINEGMYKPEFIDKLLTTNDLNSILGQLAYAKDQINELYPNDSKINFLVNGLYNALQSEPSSADILKYCNAILNMIK